MSSRNAGTIGSSKRTCKQPEPGNATFLNLMTSIQSKPTPAVADPMVREFERRAGQTPTTEPSWVLPLRRAGFNRFSETGYPTIRDEDWRFTNIAPVAKLPFQTASLPGAESVTAEQIDTATFGTLPGPRLVFVNGYFSAALSRPSDPTAKSTIGNLAAHLEGNASVIQPLLTPSQDILDDPFACLNTAFFQDGAFIHVPAGAELKDPIHLVFIATNEAKGASIHTRNLIIAEAGSRFTVIESCISFGAQAYVANSCSNFVVREGASLEHVKFQDESPDAFHLANLHSDLGAASQYTSHSFALGGLISRNTIRSKLNGPGLECIFNGLYVTRRNQVADHHMVINHNEPNCASHEYFNGILDDESKGVFHGRILVQPEAQKTDAKQTNKNILLSNSATVDSKPQLEIYADDVKCTHGATVGQLNEESIFYLRSRGIGKETARRMLIHSFAGEITERVQCTPVREEIDRIVWNRLEESPSLSEKLATASNGTPTPEA